MILNKIRKLFTSKVSKESPEWFKVYDDKTLNDANRKYIENKESLHVLSKFQRWITITPKSKNRNKPLENVKLVNYFN
jgi:hypothetical protein